MNLMPLCTQLKIFYPWLVMIDHSSSWWQTLVPHRKMNFYWGHVIFYLLTMGLWHHSGHQTACSPLYSGENSRNLFISMMHMFGCFGFAFLGWMQRVYSCVTSVGWLPGVLCRMNVTLACLFTVHVGLRILFITDLLHIILTSELKSLQSICSAAEQTEWSDNNRD